MLETRSGYRFGYDAEQAAEQNSEAVKRMEEWYETKGILSKLDPRTGKYGV